MNKEGLAIIQVENLTHIYAPGTPLAVTAIENVSLAIQKGEFVALAGPTGSGKSTLVQHFNGLLLPTRGRVLVDGGDTRDKKARRGLWQKVGLVFQYPEQQLFEKNVFDEIAFGPRNIGLNTTQVEARVNRALELVGLPESVKGVSPLHLSTGQRRRVALAAVLAVEPEIFVLDEPAVGLDPRGHRYILDLFKGLQKHQGKTVILITHNMKDIARLADRVLVLDKGQLVMQGNPREVFASPEPLKSIGLSLPMPAELMFRLQFGSVALTLDEAEVKIKRLLERKMIM